MSDESMAIWRRFAQITRKVCPAFAIVITDGLCLTAVTHRKPADFAEQTELPTVGVTIQL